ncbi:hypothetical protein QWY86_06175 [Pedobacter aquatilis]|uniref:DUF6588 family protein n=1 Tax=Pedobacter aquatilis TaxID=351343 RepID=UPI0025B28764|nr:DUF6588 family protein [Pedobacter aquatilis]MDN3586245.1 hypothetical protein [Pedobacter aquatilis]
MKKTIILFLSAISLLIHTASAQFNFEQLIQSGPQDAEKLVDAYTRPLFYGFGLGMNSGWTNTAQTLGPLHFDLRVVGTGSLVPSSRQSFDITGIGLSNNLRPSDPLKTVSPTFTGDTRMRGPMVDLFDGNNNKLVSFELPAAVIGDIVPTPQLQLTAGFFGNTEIMVRAAPKVRLGEYFGSVSLLGLGAKHNIARDFVGNEVVKTPFDFSILAGFTRLQYSMALDLQPLNGMIPETPDQAKDFSGQEIYASFDNYILQATLSKQISFFTPFVSAGYSISGAKLGLKGNFPIVNSIRDNQLAYITYTNPFELKRTYLKTFRGDVGLQLKFPILRVYAAYGFSGGYGMLSGGLGIGF